MLLLLPLFLFPVFMSAQYGATQPYEYSITRPGAPTRDYQPEGRIIRNPRATIEIYDELGLLSKRTILLSGISFASGLMYGIHETVVHKPFRIPDGWNRQWWDSRQSWRNKYKEGDPSQGRAFIGSTGALVWTTDAKHLFGAGYRLTMFGAGLTVAIGERRKFKEYFRDALISSAAFQVGFHLSYNTKLIFQ